MEEGDRSRRFRDDPMEWRSPSSREPFDRFHDEREEERRRAGFLYDRGTQEQRGGTFNGYDGLEAVEYRPGFNPPRRAPIPPNFSQLPAEINSMIVEKVGGVIERSKTRGVNRFQSQITRGIVGMVRDTVKGLLRAGGWNKDTISRHEDGPDVYRFDRLVRDTYASMFEQLGIPFGVTTLGKGNFGDTVVIHYGRRVSNFVWPDPSKRVGNEYVHEFHVTYWGQMGKKELAFKDIGANMDETVWTNYPILREITKSMEKYIKYMQVMDTRQADVYYLAFTNSRRKKYLYG